MEVNCQMLARVLIQGAGMAQRCVALAFHQCVLGLIIIFIIVIIVIIIIILILNIELVVLHHYSG